MSHIPAYLKKGDSVIFVSPARKISLKEIQPFINLIEEWGLQSILAPNLFKEEHQFAGTDQERTHDFQYALDHPEAKAVICVRGGYGSVRIIDSLDFTNFIKNPKWLVGYSDITVFHEHINQNFNIPTIHATMPINFNSATPETLNSLHKTLFGIPYSFSFYQNNSNKNSFQNLKGKIVGGNLSIIYSLLGSPSSINTDGKILFIEDLDEYLYHIDRMLWNLKRNGFFDNLKALFVGGMGGMHDNTIPFGKNATEIILEICKEYDFPIFFDIPAGHLDHNLALILNKECELTTTDKNIQLHY